MVTLHSFTEALDQYGQGTIPFRLLQEQTAVLIGVCENPHADIADSLEITDTEIGWLSAQPESEEDYEGFLGGNFHICQSPEDLLAIVGFDAPWAKAHNGSMPNVTDVPMSWDSCGYLAEANGEPHWVQFLLCSNNAGGDVYYVPKELWELARVEEHITATKQFWA